MTMVKIRRPFARHNHARNKVYDKVTMGGGIMPLVIPHMTKQYWGALWMPNVVPFLTTEETTLAYIRDLKASTPADAPNFAHVTVGYLQDGMDPELIQ
jgi:dihydroorotase